jgi:hypothetical protein
MRIAADGAVTLANAGHLPPYLIVVTRTAVLEPALV